MSFQKILMEILSESWTILKYWDFELSGWNKKKCRKT